MNEITEFFSNQEKAQQFSNQVWEILNGLLTESDDEDLKRMIEFYNENDHCEMVIRKVSGGVEFLGFFFPFVFL